MDLLLDLLEELEIYRKIIPSNIGDVGYVVKEGIHQLVRNYGNIHRDILFEIRVIFNELIINAVMHGNKENADKFVKIVIGITKNKCMLLSVTDDGEGYNYNSLIKNYCNTQNNAQKSYSSYNTQDNYPWERIEETGRGIRIIVNLCDKVGFNKRGNEIVVLKRLEK